jgi:hypothetical protein
MPVHINEMIIRANIMDGKPQAPAPQPAASGEVNKDEIIKECAALILEMLKEQNQR